MYGLTVIAFGLAPNLALGMLAFAAAGFAFLVAISTFNTTVQLQVDESLRGRVMGFYIMGFTAAFPLGSLLQGWLADVVGVQTTITGAGLLLVAVAAGLWMRPGVVARLDLEAPPDEEPAAPPGAVAAD